jgi:hypothetical protein
VTIERQIFEQIENIRHIPGVYLFDIGGLSYQVYYNVNKMLRFGCEGWTPKAVVRQKSDKHGGFYLMCSLRGQKIRYHRLVSFLRYGKKIFGMEIDHKDGDRENHRLSNLAVVTPAQNMHSARARGAYNKQGAKNDLGEKLKKQKAIRCSKRG